MGRGAGGNNNNHHHHNHYSSPSSSSSSSSSLSRHMRKALSTDLRLGLSLSAGRPPAAAAADEEEVIMDERYGGGRGGATFFVKVYMEGIPIGRKLDLWAYGCYEDMITTLDDMFGTNILWNENNYNDQQVQYHVLTYEDKEGDWLIVGDVPWEMFVSSVKRLKITRADSL
ncbi:unnamed protein product [Linum tenue]|uniref:Auxin-responsive protein n=2 Tax=Linum tenue TaxID=586396 RepID=A0AAV0PHN5_9ROSI|nr:unnamed protein product [Linum tenue]